MLLAPCTAADSAALVDAARARLAAIGDAVAWLPATAAAVAEQVCWESAAAHAFLVTADALRRDLLRLAAGIDDLCDDLSRARWQHGTGCW